MKQIQDLKKFIVRLLLISISVLIVGGFNYWADPLQFYRKKPVAELYPMERYQIPGIAKNYDYNAVVLGTSLTENFSPAYIEKVLGYKTVKLTMEGSAIKEEYLALDLALQTGKPDCVIWGLDLFSFRPFDEEGATGNADFPYYFYDSDPLNDYHYLFNASTTEVILRQIIAAGKGPAASETQMLDNYKSWYQQYSFSRELVCQDYIRVKPAKSYTLENSPYKWENVKAITDEYVIKPVREHPDVQFIYFFPPYSLLGQCYVNDSCPELFDLQFRQHRYIYEQLKDCPNVRVFDFQAEESIILGLDHYKDVVHYDETVNDWMVDCFKNGRCILNESSLKANEEGLRRMVAGVKVENKRVFYNGQPLH